MWEVSLLLSFFFSLDAPPSRAWLPQALSHAAGKGRRWAFQLPVMSWHRPALAPGREHDSGSHASRGAPHPLPQRLTHALTASFQIPCLAGPQSSLYLSSRTLTLF